MSEDNENKVQESNSNNIVNDAVEIFKSCKNKEYTKAIKLFLGLLLALYSKHIKGKYITVNNKKIPYAAILAVVVVLLFLIMSGGSSAPDGDADSVPDLTKKEEIVQKQDETVIYNKNNIKIYGVHKCDQAICGNVENTGKKSFSKLTISVTFNKKSGEVLYDNGTEFPLPVDTIRKFTIPSNVPFDKYVLKDVSAI